MSGVNKVILVGRLGKDPDVKRLDNGTAVAEFSIATSETWKDKSSGEKREDTEWHNIKLWRQPAEFVEKFVKKGDNVYIEGKLKTTSWEKDGVTRYKTEVVGDIIKPMGGNNNSQVDNASTQATSAPNPATNSSGETDDLPF